MRIFVIDTEYLTWNNSKSTNNSFFRIKKNPAEIIQVFVKEIFVKSKNEKLIYIKPSKYKSYPHRITRLTSIKKKFLDDKGIDFKFAYKILLDFFPKKSIIISNGFEYKIIDINKSLHGIKKSNKKLFFLNFYHLIKNDKLFYSLRKRSFITNKQIKHKLKLRGIKSHNAKNDVNVLIKCLKNKNFKKGEIVKYSKYFKVYYL